MKRNIQNVDYVIHEKDLSKVNSCLSDGYIIITTVNNTYHEDGDYGEIVYSLGHLIKESTDETLPDALG
jgi:hypothetical protein